MERRIALLLVFGLLPGGPLYAAQTAQSQFKVSATVQAVCTIVATDLAFGNYSSGSISGGQTPLKATCSPDTTYTIGLNAGTSPGATTSARKMISGANQLAYELYSDSSFTTPWGNTIGTDTVAGTGNGLQKDHPVFGRIPAGQNVAAGAYQDVITVTITY